MALPLLILAKLMTPVFLGQPSVTQLPVLTTVNRRGGGSVGTRYQCLIWQLQCTYHGVISGFQHPLHQVRRDGQGRLEPDVGRGREGPEWQDRHPCEQCRNQSWSKLCSINCMCTSFNV